MPAALEQRRGRVLAVVLDVARLALAGLVGGLARRLGGQAAGVPLAVLEVEVRDALLALGAALLTELVRLRGTGDRGPSYVCPCGVRLRRKEVAPLRQRTWCGEVTLERTVYAGAGCAVRAHHVPLDAAWGLLGRRRRRGCPSRTGARSRRRRPGRGRPAWPPRSPPPSRSSGPGCPTPRPPASWRWPWAPRRAWPPTPSGPTRGPPGGRARSRRPPRWPGGGA